MIFRVWFYVVVLKCVEFLFCDLIECISIFFMISIVMEYFEVEYDQGIFDNSYWGGVCVFFVGFLILILLCVILY